MTLEQDAKLFMERMYDVLWHNDALKDNISELTFKQILERDVMEQLRLIKKDIEE